MKTAKIMFQKLIQDSQDYGSDAEHMVSRIFFSLEVDGSVRDGLFANIKQLVGGDFEKDPLEVSRPENYCGPFNYEAFQDVAEKYFRLCVGAAATGIRIQGCSNVRMRNNTFIKSAIAEFQITEAGTGW